MGHQIRAGDRAIRFSRGANLVVSWVESFTPPPPRPADPALARFYDEERDGVTFLNWTSVQLANSRVPILFDDAEREGFTKAHLASIAVDCDEFNECRDFLAYAAKNRLEISGSY
jgi:predicted FMN-binding regulatory protein PaiB